MLECILHNGFYLYRPVEHQADLLYRAHCQVDNCISAGSSICLSPGSHFLNNNNNYYYTSMHVYVIEHEI